MKLRANQEPPPGVWVRALCTGIWVYSEIPALTESTLRREMNTVVIVSAARTPIGNLHSVTVSMEITWDWQIGHRSIYTRFLFYLNAEESFYNWILLYGLFLCVSLIFYKLISSLYELVLALCADELSLKRFDWFAHRLVPDWLSCCRVMHERLFVIGQSEVTREKALVLRLDF